MLTTRSFPRRAGHWCRAGMLAAMLTPGSAAPAGAHDPGLSSLEVSVGTTTLLVRLSLAPRDAEAAAALEAGRRVSDLHGSAAVAALDAFARRALEVQVGGRRLTVDRATVERAGDATVTVELTYARPGGSRLTVRSRTPERLAAGHRQLVTVRASGGQVVSERMIGGIGGGEPIALDVAAGVFDRARQFFVLGVAHILSGYDHLLFLAGLLLGVHGVRGVATTASAFTLGHSLTLGSAVLGLVTPPAGLIEPLIAASIAYVGIENLVSTDTSSRWRTAFAFGLIHGFGFAGALQDLGAGAGPAVPLAFFNLGVEAGQVAVAMLMLPAFWFLRTRHPWGPRLLRPCSALVALGGGCWFVARLAAGSAV